MNKLKYILIISIIISSFVELQAKNRTKAIIKDNMNISYKYFPSKSYSLYQALSNGMFYGRLRTNSYFHKWEKEVKGERENNYAIAVGGSLIYKSAPYNGLSLGLGLYTSQLPSSLNMSKNKIQYLENGLDFFNKRVVHDESLSYSDYSLNVLGQAYLSYRFRNNGVKVGRQLYESLFTSSDDINMIPNSFDGISWLNKSLRQTSIRVAYFTSQKLGSNQSSHDVITYKDKNGNIWRNNNDRAIHKGLTYQNFKANNKDTNHALIIADLKSKIFNNSTFKLGFLALPDVLQDFIFEADYNIKLDKSWSLTPAIRYFNQMDSGGGDIAGSTNLDGRYITGYYSSVINSLDSSLFAARVDLKHPEGYLRVGASFVDDKADIIAPWRAFPTDGFTRAKGRYNWYSNTQSLMIEGMYKLPNSKLYAKYIIENYDEDKDVLSDSKIVQIDFLKNFQAFPNLYMKICTTFTKDYPKSTDKADLSYNEYRLEFNYLF